MATHLDTGTWGEAQAAAYLENRGYEILEQNYRYGHAEIDLIARKGRLLVFVEVKTRKGAAFGYPETFVHSAKKRRILQAAENYIFDSDWQADIRFDIIAVLSSPSAAFELLHIEDAFF